MYAIQCLESQYKHFYSIIRESVPAAWWAWWNHSLDGWKAPTLGFTLLLELPNPIGSIGCVCGGPSKIKAWHQVIETIPYTSGKKPNLVIFSAEKEIIPCCCPELQESKSSVILHLQKRLAFSWTDSKACDYKVWNFY